VPPSLFGIHAGNLCKFIVPLSVLFQAFLFYASIFWFSSGVCLLSKYWTGCGESELNQLIMRMQMFGSAPMDRNE